MAITKRVEAAPAAIKDFNELLKKAKSVKIDKKTTTDPSIVITMSDGDEYYISADDENGRKIGWSRSDESGAP